MYQALYRKYRPSTLDDICGQDTIVRIIKNTIKNNQMNHAYLFAGPRGTGKTSIAKIVAKIVNCHDLDGYNPCNKCVSCTEVNNSDIIEIDAASNNGVDEIRELRNKINLVPSYGKYKVYIIDEVHMLTTGAFNALLKTLEEPPEHIIFILATTDPHKIPETILSRCQRLDFQKISQKAIKENLKKISEKENIKVSDEALDEIARISDGGMRDSVGMLDQARAYAEDNITLQDIYDINGTVKEEDLKKFIKSIIDNDIETSLEILDEYNSKGVNFVKLTEEIIDFTKDILIYKKAPKYFKNANVENIKDLANSDAEIYINIIEMLNRNLFEMKETSDTKLLLELAIIKLISKHQSEKKEVLQEKPKIQNIAQKPLIGDINVKKETTRPISPLENSELKKQINQIKETRIENTLAKYNRVMLKQITLQLDNLKELILNEEYSSAASLLLDGKLKAGSDENLLFVYASTRQTNIFNENLIPLENTIEKALNKKYRIIAVSNDEWEKIKNEYNSKKRKYEYHEENFDIEKIFKNKNNNIISMFEDIIEYN